MTSAHPPFDVRIFHKECRSLARAGYRVTLIAPTDRDRQCGDIFVRAFPKYRSRRQRMVKGTLAMYRAAKQENADIYHFHDPELIPVGLLLRASGRHVVYDAHEDLPKTISYKTYVPAWLRVPLQAVVKVLEEFAVRFLSGVIAATGPIAERFSKIDRRVVVHNYPLLEEFPAHATDSSTEPGHYIAYVGARITRGRGAVEMVQAIGLVRPELEVQLKLAGAFDPADLPKRLSELPGWNRTDCLGLLGRTEVARMLRRARAGLVLLHPEANYLNSQPVKLFEYMGAAIPVLASDFPVWRNVIESAGCGLLVNPLKPASIASAIEYLCTHPEEADEMGRRGRKAVEDRYNWIKEEQKLLEFYSGLAGSEPDVVSVHLEARA
ncbi:MAG: glycosyltransferase [Candidatus Acidiferrales bacterium]